MSTARKKTRVLTSEHDDQGHKRQVEVERFENGCDKYGITDQREIEAVSEYLTNYMIVQTAGNASSSFDGVGAAELAHSGKTYQEHVLDASRFIREAREASPAGMTILELAFVAELGPVALGQRFFPSRRKQVQISKAKESVRNAVLWLVEFNHKK